MKENITFQEYESLCDEARRHDILYYAEHAPAISDEEYDHLVKTIAAIEKKHPEWVTAASPTQRIGEALTSGFKTIAHKVPMLSLANTYSKEEIEDFVKRLQKLSGKKDLAFSCELKMDGIAITVHYEKGVFTQGVTRGDGRFGDDITANLRTIQALPLKLHGKNLPDRLEIRGEVFMRHGVFKELNEERDAAGDVVWANPRNAAAGSLKLLDPAEVAQRKLSIVFYGIAENSETGLKSQYQVHHYLKELGLPTLQLIQKCCSLEEIWEFAEKVKNERGSLSYDIDGIVIKLDDLQEQQRLGATGKNPRWAVAYKFAAEQAQTKIREITVQVGRTGVMTPVAELDPVFLAGSTIARATLHNQDEVQRKDIREGDYVIIEKGGDVIPKVVSVLLEKRVPDLKPWSMPANCPSCGAPLVHVPGEVAVRCPNSEGCPEQQLRKIVYFASKPCMDIDNLGWKVAEQLFRRGFVKKPSDIYTLSEIELYQLEGFKAKSVCNLLSSIEKSKDVPLPKFIMALGIKYVGTGTAEDLSAKVGDIETLSRMDFDALRCIQGVGEKIASAIVEFFHNQSNREELQRLLALGVKPRQVEVIHYSGHPFNGKTFVLTGTLQHYTRNTAASLIKERGGKVTDAVSKKTDFLVAGEAAGSKLDKARNLGIPILSEEEFKKLL